MAMQRVAAPFPGMAHRSDTLARGSAARGSTAERLLAPALCAEAAVGALLGVYVLVGRWSPFRLLGEEPLYTQVRFWIVLALATALPVVLLRPGRCGTDLIRRVLIPMAAFLGYMIATIAWTPLWEAALPKALDLALMLLVAVLSAPLVRRCDPQKLAQAFWWTVVVCAGLNALLVTASGVWTLASGDRVTVLGGGPNAFARIMALLCIGGIYFWMRARVAIGWLAVAASAVVLVLASGSRGGLLALPFALITLGVRSNVSRLRALTAAGLVAGAVSLLVTHTDLGANTLQTFDRRIRQLTFEERYDSGRAAIYERALQMGLDSPLLGGGLDAFQLTDYQGLYQHNVLIEAFSEGGSIALILLLTSATIALRHVIAAKTPEELGYAAAFVMIAAGSQVSGDLFDSRGLFLMPLLLAGALARRTLPAGRRP
jgi:O-antigen ligase